MKYILSLFLLFFTTLSYAATPSFIGLSGLSTPNVGSIPCSGFNTFIRGANTSGDTESYEKGVDDFCASDWVATDITGINSYSPDAYVLGTHSLKMSDDSTAVGGRIVADHGSYQTSQYYRFYFYIPEGFASGNTGTIGGVGKYATSSVGSIRFAYLSGSTFLLGSASSTETITVSSGSWFRVEFYASDADGSGAGLVSYVIKVFDQDGNATSTSNGSNDYEINYTTTTDSFMYFHMMWTFTGTLAKSVFVDGVKNCDNWCGAE